MKLTIDSVTGVLILIVIALLPSCGGSSTPPGCGSNCPPAFSFQVLYSFVGGADGATPRAGVIADASGNLYGMTSSGGTAAAGVIYTLGSTGKEGLLYTFKGLTDGETPTTTLTRDSVGNLYGTAGSSSGNGFGVVFRLDPGGNETLLYTFSGGADGGFPNGGVVRDPAGNIYGTVTGGGTLANGLVYKIDPNAVKTELHTFSGPDGDEPAGDLVQDAAGNLYGLTWAGGSSLGSCFAGAGCGVIFKIDAAGNFSVLHSFTGTDGGSPNALTLDSSGNIYGTAVVGGAANAGVVFRIDPQGNETVLYDFTGGTDGASPVGPLARDGAGNLYGTASNGGDLSCGFSGCGVVFQLAPNGKLTVLHTFTDSDGAFPGSGLILDKSGHLYGTTQAGGAQGLGVVFKL